MLAWTTEVWGRQLTREGCYHVHHKKNRISILICIQEKGTTFKIVKQGQDSAQGLRQVGCGEGQMYTTKLQQVERLFS